jgi:hypothetical protein
MGLIQFGSIPMNIKDINYRCADLLNNPCEFNEFKNKDVTLYPDFENESKR